MKENLNQIIIHRNNYKQPYDNFMTAIWLFPAFFACIAPIHWLPLSQTTPKPYHIMFYNFFCLIGIVL